MNKAEKFLSDVVVFTKYSQFDEDKNKRKGWLELCDTNEAMHIKKYPQIAEDIKWAFQYVRNKTVLPSMRSMQYAGVPIEMNPVRIYNCCYGAVNHPFFFAETAFLLLSGAGVGYSVRNNHIKELPKIYEPDGTRRFLIGDSIEGWADSYRQLFYAYFKKNPLPVFDYSDIRPKGSPIKTSGGVAPGPEKLRESHILIERILNQAKGRKLNSLEGSDLICIIADAIVAGGKRDSALIGLFDDTDTDMATSKGTFKIHTASVTNTTSEGWEIQFQFDENQTMNTNDYSNEEFSKVFISNKWGDYDLTNAIENGKLPWYYVHPYRGRANISVAALRNKTSEEKFRKLMKTCELSGSGEPGVFWCHTKEEGANPCNEINFSKPFYFCNLTTQSVADVTTQEELNNRTKAATIIGTCQAGYTDFHYLRPIWKETTEDQALLGVSMTGVASAGPDFYKLNIKEAAELAVAVNKDTARKIGINMAHRVTCIKPEGSGTLVAGVQGNGIHGIHDDFYFRNNRIKKFAPIHKHLEKHFPKELIQDEFQNENLVSVISIPMKAPKDSVRRNNESELDVLERVKYFHENWIKPGHNIGDSTNNVSCTINVKQDNWDLVVDWMWDNRDHYNGISCFPYSGATYKQAPFETITEDQYNKAMDLFPENIFLNDIVEKSTDVETTSELACASGACAI